MLMIDSRSRCTQIPSVLFATVIRHATRCGIASESIHESATFCHELARQQRQDPPFTRSDRRTTPVPLPRRCIDPGCTRLGLPEILRIASALDSRVLHISALP